jgi:DNA-binding transcriptional MerR regulator
MLIGELAARTGLSARALRHYEDQGILAPARTSGGYRDYADSDVVRVAQIHTMITAGLSTLTIRRYLDCVHSDGEDASLEMCPDLRAELQAVAQRLEAKQAELRATQQRISELVGDAY